MENPILTATLLNFSAVAAAVLQRAPTWKRSRISQLLFVPLNIVGLFGWMVAIYCLANSQGWLAGLGIWCISIFVLAIVAQLIRAVADGAMAILGLLSGIAGYWLFCLQFLR